MNPYNKDSLFFKMKQNKELIPIIPTIPMRSKKIPM